jgi:3-oxoadipate enol-lactonase
LSAVAVDHEVLPGPAGSPTVVLSSSLGATRAMWDRSVERLTDFFTVVRYDTRGHGASPVVPGPYTIDDLADDVVALLDRLDLHRVHFVGLSLGGMTGLRLAARNPERLDRLVVLCTSALLGPAVGWVDRAELVRASGAEAVAPTVVQRWYSPAFLVAEPQRVAAAEAMVAATPREGYAGCCEAIAAMDLTEDLPLVTAPTLAIAGQDDPATPPEHLERIATTVRHGRLLVVPDAAHLAIDEQPGTITAAIVAHLQGEA